MAIATQTVTHTIETFGKEREYYRCSLRYFQYKGRHHIFFDDVTPNGEHLNTYIASYRDVRDARTRWKGLRNHLKACGWNPINVTKSHGEPDRIPASR